MALPVGPEAANHAQARRAGMKRQVNTEIICGVVGLVLTAVFFFSLEDISWLSIIFPRTVVYVMGIMSVILVVMALVNPTHAHIFSAGSNPRWIVTGILFFLWVIFMPIVGFFVSTVVFMTTIVGFLARARTQVTFGKLLIWTPIVIAEVTVFHLIFTKVLYVPLPEGLFF
jgi:hypothetical protein